MKNLIKKLVLLTMIGCLVLTPIIPNTLPSEDIYEVMPLDDPTQTKITTQ